MNNFTLVAQDPALAAAWRKEFDGIEAVTVLEGSIFSLAADAIVSPANSFGFMDGGLDALLTSVLGNHVQAELQRDIEMIYDGELLVGQAHVVSTKHVSWPYLISAPTMRVPMILPADTVNAYLAARAIFLTAKRRGFTMTLIPGLGTGVGGISPQNCAMQMRRAYDAVTKTGTYGSWKAAQTAHQRLYTNVTRDLQYK